MGFNDKENVENEKYECWSNEVDSDALNKRTLAAKADRDYLAKVNKGKPEHKHRKATKPSVVSIGHCHATPANHNLDSDPEDRFDVTNCNVCICEAPNYMNRLKTKEVLERNSEAEDEAVDEVEDNGLDEAIQVELDRIVEVEVDTSSSLEGISDHEATPSKERTDEVVESIEDILEKIDQSGLVKIRNSLIDAVIDQEGLTVTTKDNLQPKMGKNAKKRQRREKENHEASKKKNLLF